MVILVMLVVVVVTVVVVGVMVVVIALPLGGRRGGPCVDLHRLNRMALSPNRFAVRYVSGEEVYIPADGLQMVVNIDSKVRAWLALSLSVVHVWLLESCL